MWFGAGYLLPHVRFHAGAKFIQVAHEPTMSCDTQHMGAKIHGTPVESDQLSQAFLPSTRSTALDLPSFLHSSAIGTSELENGAPNL